MAWMCSGCGEIFLEPTSGTTPEEKGTILTDEFLRHLATAHEKKRQTETWNRSMCLTYVDLLFR